jgi:hypothetical protein
VFRLSKNPVITSISTDYSSHPYVTCDPRISSKFAENLPRMRIVPWNQSWMPPSSGEAGRRYEFCPIRQLRWRHPVHKLQSVAQHAAGYSQSGGAIDLAPSPPLTEAAPAEADQLSRFRSQSSAPSPLASSAVAPLQLPPHHGSPQVAHPCMVEEGETPPMARGVCAHICGRPRGYPWWAGGDSSRCHWMSATNEQWAGSVLII